MAFWISYDHLGKWLVINILLFFYMALCGTAVSVALTFPFPGVVVAIVLLLGSLFGLFAALQSINCMLRDLIEARDVSLKCFFTGLKTALNGRLTYWFVHFSIGMCLVFAVFYYALVVGTHIPWMGYGLSAISLWLLLLWGLITLLLPPAMAWKQDWYGPILKLCALLLLDNPVFMLGMAMSTLFLGILTIMPPMVVLFSVVPELILLSCGYEVLSRKYALLEAFGESSRTRLTAADWKDEEDDFLNRSIRDIIFPWKT